MHRDQGGPPHREPYYDPDGYGISSTAPEDEIAAIIYDLPPMNPKLLPVGLIDDIATSMNAFTSAGCVMLTM